MAFASGRVGSGSMSVGVAGLPACRVGALPRAPSCPSAMVAVRGVFALRSLRGVAVALLCCAVRALRLPLCYLGAIVALCFVALRPSGCFDGSMP